MCDALEDIRERKTKRRHVSEVKLAETKLQQAEREQARLAAELKRLKGKTKT